MLGIDTKKDLKLGELRSFGNLCKFGEKSYASASATFTRRPLWSKYTLPSTRAWMV